MPAPPSVILFDLDGTLIDTHRLYLEAYRRAVASVLGYAPDDREILGRRPAPERRFLREWAGQERGEQCHDDFCRHYQALHGPLAGSHDGVREMLGALRSAGLTLGVVTGKGRRTWEISDAALGLGPFAVVVTDDDVRQCKPHPEGLFAALEALGADPADAAYIGDTRYDLEAGRAAGMRVGTVLWPHPTDEARERFLEQVTSLGPDWVFARPADVTRTFAAWC